MVTVDKFSETILFYITHTDFLPTFKLNNSDNHLIKVLFLKGLELVKNLNRIWKNVSEN